MNGQSFLGKGWSFPPRFNSKNGIEMSHGEQDISESIGIILNTHIGERIMNPNFGSRLREFVFQPINNSQVHIIKEHVFTVLSNFEHRIKVMEVIVDDSQYLEGIVNVEVDYIVSTTNSRFNMVFPFYRFEGSEAPKTLMDPSK